MKPDWKDAPSWAGWLVRDEDGYWFWFEYEPRHNCETGGWDNQHIHGQWGVAYEPKEGQSRIVKEERP